MKTFEQIWKSKFSILTFLALVVGAFFACRAHYLNPEGDFWCNSSLWSTVALTIFLLAGLGLLLFIMVCGRIADEKKEKRQQEEEAEVKEKYANFVGLEFLLRVNPDNALVDESYVEIDALKGFHIGLNGFADKDNSTFIPVRVVGFKVQFDTFIEANEWSSAIIVIVRPVDRDYEFKILAVEPVWILASHPMLCTIILQRKNYGLAKVGGVIKYNFAEN